MECFIKINEDSRVHRRRQWKSENVIYKLFMGDLKTWKVRSKFEEGDIITNSSVFLVSWIDGNYVKMMNTIHGVRDWQNNFLNSRPTTS